MFHTEIIKTESILTMVKTYQSACSKIEEAYKLFREVEESLTAVYGNSVGTFNPFHYLRWGNSSSKDMILAIRKECWKSILNKIEIKKVMSSKALKKIDESLSGDEVPELAYSAVLEIITGMVNTAHDYSEELYQEALDHLLPGRRGSDHFKTNHKYARRAVSSKVILTRMVSCYRAYSVSGEYAERELLAIDKAFHLLDGKGIPSGYRSPLVDEINKGKSTGQTEYFKFKCYENGNLHLSFLRQDLVKELNKHAGNIIAGVV